MSRRLNWAGLHPLRGVAGLAWLDAPENQRRHHLMPNGPKNPLPSTWHHARMAHEKKVTQDDMMLPHIIFYRLICINGLINIILLFSAVCPDSPVNADVAWHERAHCRCQWRSRTPVSTLFLNKSVLVHNDCVNAIFCIDPEPWLAHPISARSRSRFHQPFQLPPLFHE
jgi:hypothetical protein